MPDCLKIRQAAPADLEGVVALVGLVVGQMASEGLDQWDEHYPDRACLARDVQSGTLFVVEGPGGVPGGMMVLSEECDPAYLQAPWQGGQRPLYLHRLCVHPQGQQKGLGARMMAWAEGFAREKGYDCLRFDCYCKNVKANRLYPRLGYLRHADHLLRFEDNRPDMLFYPYDKLL